MPRFASVLLVSLLATFFVFISGRLARADMLQDVGATFQQAAQDLAAAFPKVEARLVAVEGDQVRLDGPNVEALRPGLELVVYRRGEVFRHPITGQVLGHAELTVGTLVVTAVSGTEATARVASTEAGREPEVGDGARITAGRLAVAVLPPVGVNVPFETADQAALLLVARLSSLLEKTGRFLAADPQKVLDTAKAGATGPAPSALDVARRLGVPAVLSSRVAGEGRARYLETTWISARTGDTLASTRTPLARAAYPPRFVWEQTPELEQRYALEGSVRGLALADLDGTERPALVVGDEQTVSVYRWEEAKGPVVVPGSEFRPGGLILSLDAADLSGTGRAQVVVVDYLGTGRTAVRSRVLEWTTDRFKVVYEVTGRYLRVARVDREPWLLEQTAGESAPFEPTIHRVVWQAGRYHEGPRIRVPSGVTVFGLALMRLTGSAEPDIVALTADDHLEVWTAKGQRLWTSTDRYGGGAVSFDYTPISGGLRELGATGVIGRVFGRVIPLPEPAGARPELLVFANSVPFGGQAVNFLPRLAPTLVSQGRVDRLQWRDGAFVRIWQSAVTDGYIGDFGYGDVTGDGVAEVVVGVVPRGLTLETLNPVGRPKAHLVLYELP